MMGYYFTDDLRHVIAAAREESIRLRHEYVGTEHLVLAFASGKAPAASRLLEALSVDPARLRAYIEDVVQPGSGEVRSAEKLPYTARSKKCLELALDTARDAGQNYVGIEHMLAGIIREEKGIGAQVLADNGVTERAIIALVADVPQQPAPPMPGPPESASGDFVVHKVSGPSSLLARIWQFVRRILHT